MGEDQHNSKELCLVVLGGIESGKTSLINSLLGHRDIRPNVRTANCFRHHGWLRDRKLIVVDTPGWYKGYPLIDTAQRTKDELVLSVKQCPSGPHAFILAIEVAGFTERNLRAVIEHLGLLGEDIWRHTIVVFTRGELLKNKTIEQHIMSEGEALKSVVEKCGNRFCVFDKQTNGCQVIQLMEQIESLVNSNCGRHFQPDEKTFREVEERTDAQQTAQERASARQFQIQEKRKRLREQFAGVPRLLSEVRIVLFGWVVSGKTLARNILKKEEPVSQRKTEECETDTGSVDGRHITVVDTPGWWKYFSAQYTPDRVNIAIKESVSLGSKSPHALLLVVPADVSFLEEQRKILEDNMKRMLGEMAWKHTIVLTWGDSLGNTSIEEHIESEGQPLSWLVEKCGNRYHVFDNVNRGEGTQVRELLEKIDELEASFDFVGLTRESPKTEITPSYENKDKIDPEMVKLVDKEWNRRDKVLEERVRGLWQETFGSAGRGDNSLDLRPDFRENEVPPNFENRLQVDLPQTKTSDLKHTGAFPSEHCQQFPGLPRPPQDNREMKEKFEREWGRCKTTIMDRVRGILLASEEAERGPHKHGSKELKEWARQYDDIMGNVRTIISEICSQSVFSSEPGNEEHHQSIDKVLTWKTQTSGLGSELDIEENDDCCTE